MKLKRFRSKLFIAVALLVVPPTVSAVTDAELEGKLERLEKQRQIDSDELGRLKQQVNGITNKIETQSGKTSTVTTTKIKKLQESVDNLDRTAIKRVSNLKKLVSKGQERMTINGYLTAGASKASEETQQQPAGYEDEYNFRTDSRIGLQFTYQITDQVDAITQFVSRGYKDFRTRADWLMLRYKVTDDLILRAGRMRIPIFAYSETLDVGYSYPWVRLPLDTSNSSLNNYEGLDALSRFEAGEWNVVTEVYGGRFFNDELGGVGGAQIGFDTEDMWGLTATGTYDAWTIRAGMMRANIKFESGNGGIVYKGRDTLDYKSFSAQYDDGTYFALLELGELKTDVPNAEVFEPGSPVPEGFILSVQDGVTYVGEPTVTIDSAGIYQAAHGASTNDYGVGTFTFGVRMGQWMPFYVMGYTQSLRDIVVFEVTNPFATVGNAIGEEKNKTNSVGVRYDLSSTVAIKYQLDYFYDFAEGNDQTLVFGINGSGTKPDFGESVILQTLVVDALF